jgi:hypothetical protein
MVTILVPGDLPTRSWFKKYLGFIVGVPAIVFLGWWGIPIMLGAGYWWFDNDEASAQGNTFYYRYIRNPMQNFRWYVIGLADRPHYVTGRYGNPQNPIPNKRSDLNPPESGVQVSVNYVFGLPILPWFCVAYKHFTFYIGWEPRGGFGILLNTSNSDLK